MRPAIRYVCPLFAFLLFAASQAIAVPHLPAPPDTSSPRATLKSYLDIMSEYARLMRTDLHTKTRSSEIRDQQLEDKAEEIKLEDTLDYPPVGFTSHRRKSTSPDKEQNAKAKKNAT